MSNRRTALTSDVALQWAQMVHAFYIESLMNQSDWNATQIAFHGGTSLRLSWSSTRFSEDLDFLLSSGVKNFDTVMQRVDQQLLEMVRRVDPDFAVQTRDRTKDAQRMPAFMIAVTHPAYVGNSKIKVEYWRTKPAYLEKYPTQLRTPQIPPGFDRANELPGALSDFMIMTSNPVPAATLETAYADKLVAFATRPHLKWRDLYDLWWIGTQTRCELNLESVSEQFLHNISAYTPAQGLPPALALAQFLNRPQEELVRHADPDLKNWLPAKLWQRLQGDGVQQMVQYVRYAIAAVSDHLTGQAQQDVDLKQVRQPQRPGRE